MGEPLEKPARLPARKRGRSPHAGARTSLRVSRLGQSVWLDGLNPDLLLDGGLRRFINEDGISGILFNPNLLSASLPGSAFCRTAGPNHAAEEVYRAVCRDTVRSAADLLWATYEESDGRDGFVCVAVPPELAHDVEGMVNEAQEVWEAIDRPNAMIQVPATTEALPVIRLLTGKGINVCITHLFTVRRYREVAEAFCSGLRRRLKKGGSVRRVASVAGFSLGLLEGRCAELLFQGRCTGPSSATFARLGRQVAVATARVAYGSYLETSHGAAFRELAASGARAQRLLWIPSGPDGERRFPEDLIGPATVCAVSEATLEALRRGGQPAPGLRGHLAEAESILQLFYRSAPDARRAIEELLELTISREVVIQDRILTQIGQRRAFATAGSRL